MTLGADEFIRRFLLHVLPDGFHRIRHYGYLAKGRDSLEASLKSTCLAQALRLPPALTTRGRLSGLSVPFHPPTHGFLDTGRVKGFFVSTRLEGDGYKFPNRSSVECAWLVRRESGVVSRFEVTRSGGTPLVGRDEELELLLRR